MADLIVSCSNGKEDAERATLSFIVGNVAASADRQTAVLLTIEGVWLKPATLPFLFTPLA